MKISVEFDMTPEEFRQATGLPEISDIQQKMISLIIKNMHSSEDNYDPFGLFKPFMESGFNSMSSVFMDENNSE